MQTQLRAKDHVVVVGSSLGWLMSLLAVMHDIYDVTIIHSEHPIYGMASAGATAPRCAVVEIDPTVSSVSLRSLLDRFPDVCFCFVAAELPLRHAVARVIREGGHAVLRRDEPPFVIAATVAALMAGAVTT